MPRFIAQKALPEHSAELCDLFATPMQGSISIATLRQPDYFLGSKVQGEVPEVFLGIDSETKTIALAGNTGKRRVFINGQVMPIAYFCDLRILPAYQRGTLLPRVYKYVKENLLPAIEYAQTIIVADNKAAIDALTSGRAGLPKYLPFRDLFTYSVSLRTRLPKIGHEFRVRRAGKGDIETMQKFLLAQKGQKHFLNYYDFSRLGVDDFYRDLKIEDFYLAFQGKKLVGMVGCWLQKNFKQTKIHSYATSIQLMRPLINTFAKLTGGIRLPKAGSELNYFNVFCLLVEDNIPLIAQTLLWHLIRDKRDLGFDYCLATLDTTDPLNEAFNSLNHRIFKGKHFLITFGKDIRNQFDSRPLYFEVARI